MSGERRPLYYTFGNHMHWVDMQWLWGYDVLPGCVADMLHLCRETGAKGCVNFDGIGYEKMAAECPETLADLRAAVQAGAIEPVGCSYGQPYGLFQPGESNVRQFTYGVRSVRRLLGVRPKTFWEEEFYFFPQLPQVLSSCGFTGANLFFQWTWHTPEIPKEHASLILWEGVDGTRLPTLPRNDLNVHQWPEDFDGLLELGLINELSSPVIVQWLELMPSKDWMCRSEVLLPRLKELFGDPRFDLRTGTCADLIAELAAIDTVDGPMAGPPVRAYSMDQVWHGMLLGKNADRHPRTSRDVERLVLSAEVLASVAGLLGRPYPSWDVYPTWELDEAWRELLASQHHDNHECEGLCGFIGYHQMQRSEDAASEVFGRTHARLKDQAGKPLACNALGWTRRVVVHRDGPDAEVLEIPPFGYAPGGDHPACPHPAKVVTRGAVWTLKRGGLEVDVDTERGLVTQVRAPSHPSGVVKENAPLFDLAQVVNGSRWVRPRVAEASYDEGNGEIHLEFEPDVSAGAPNQPADPDGSFGLNISILPDESGVNVVVLGLDKLARPDPGLRAALRMSVHPAFEAKAIRADTAYEIHEAHGTGTVSRKYPTGDWMTSPQWFEHVEGAVVSHSLLDLTARDGSGLLILHDATQQWFRGPDHVEAVLNAYDPWDEARYRQTTPRHSASSRTARSAMWRGQSSPRSLERGRSYRVSSRPSTAGARTHAPSVVATPPMALRSPVLSAPSRSRTPPAFSPTPSIATP
ncbi:MAG: hypothetical protein IPJ41_11285 [Phycisphaerales bacterium]|nr:hypothetical protein [Phycisphaerales bacterium]